jgi:hypothetical protein
MLVACRLAGLSALGAHYADLNALRNKPMRQGRTIPSNFQKPSESWLRWGDADDLDKPDRRATRPPGRAERHCQNPIACLRR